VKYFLQVIDYLTSSNSVGPHGESVAKDPSNFCLQLALKGSVLYCQISKGLSFSSRSVVDYDYVFHKLLIVNVHCARYVLRKKS